MSAEDTSRIYRELSAGRTVVVAGFQGAAPNGDVTTLGRGGSDTSAVALAAVLGAKACKIYTDVDGVYEHRGNVERILALLCKGSREARGFTP